MKYIIEHLEPELFEWCLIEYEHISKLVNEDNLIFTNIKKQKDAKNYKNTGLFMKKALVNWI